jgi:LacI family transcriptional regulator
MSHSLNSLIEESTQKAARGLKRITMLDVAEKAGVTKPSVSVVLNGAKSNIHISASTRERILKAADELGYMRNGGMASIASGRFGSVALLLSTKNRVSALPAQLWEGIHDELAAQGIHLSMFRLPDEELKNREKVPKILREWMADGMLIDYTHDIPDELKALIARHKLPAIWINTKQDFDCVRPDDFGAGVAATEHLLRLGHRRIAYIDLHRILQPHYSVHDRHEGYLHAMSTAGATPNSCIAELGPPREQAAQIEGFLKNAATRPTAIIPYGAEVNAALWAASRLGLEVPRDLSIISMDPSAGEWSGIALTSYLVPEYEMGKRAGSIIQEKIANPLNQLETQVLPFLLHEGESTAIPTA